MAPVTRSQAGKLAGKTSAIPPPPPPPSTTPPRKLHRQSAKKVVHGRSSKVSKPPRKPRDQNAASRPAAPEPARRTPMQDLTPIMGFLRLLRRRLAEEKAQRRAKPPHPSQLRMIPWAMTHLHVTAIAHVARDDVAESIEDMKPVTDELRQIFWVR